jgi:hypothetical protein
MLEEMSRVGARGKRRFALRSVVAPVVLTGFSGVTCAQTVRAVVLQGDPVPGTGGETFLDFRELFPAVSGHNVAATVSTGKRCASRRLRHLYSFD